MVLGRYANLRRIERPDPSTDVDDLGTGWLREAPVPSHPTRTA